MSGISKIPSAYQFQKMPPNPVPGGFPKMPPNPVPGGGFPKMPPVPVPGCPPAPQIIPGGIANPSSQSLNIIG